MNGTATGTEFYSLIATAITVAAVCLIVAATRLFDSWKEWKRSLPSPPPPCVHEWDVRTEVVAEPIGMNISPGSYVEPYQMRAVERLNTGSTSVLMTCRKCGAVDERTLAGTPRASHFGHTGPIENEPTMGD